MNRLDELIRDTLDDRASGAPAAAPVISRVLADRSRRRRRGWLAVAATAAVTATVVAVGVGVARGPDAGGPAPVTTDTADQRTAAIYSVALERFLRESSWYGRGIPERVWVGIRPTDLVSDPGIVSDPGEPLPPEVRADISAGVADLTTLVWVDKVPVPDPDDPPALAKATITLGLIPGGEHRVMVAFWAVQGFDHAWLDSYVVERRAGTWTVTGKGGVMAIT